MAGTGKSTVARTVALKYHEQTRLGASFFFSRGGGDLSNASKFFTSVAVQLARKWPTLNRCICKAVAENEDIATRALSEQWELLVCRPLAMAEPGSLKSPLLLVIDALDECEDERDIQVILQLLTAADKLTTIQLRVLVTSRPETPIRLGFRKMAGILHQDLVLNDVPREIIDHDIAIYFRKELAAIELSERNIKRLVEKAGGLFIWAATACRFIKTGKRIVGARVSLILNSGKGIRNPEEELDQIYTKILSDSMSGDYYEEEKEMVFELFRTIVGAIMTLFNSVSTETLSKLLDKSRIEVEQTLSDLHSVLDVPQNSADPIRLLHLSFRDFLLTKERCQDPRLWVDEREAHWDIAENCLRLMSTRLKRDICGLHLPGALASEVDHSRVETCLPLEVQYACLYWVQHLQRIEAQLHDNGKVHNFLRNGLLYWLEALSLMRKTSKGILAINSLESMVLVSYI
jgi:hypothetical protein